MCVEGGRKKEMTMRRSWDFELKEAGLKSNFSQWYAMRFSVSVSSCENEGTYLKYSLWKLNEIVNERALLTVRFHENISSIIIVTTNNDLLY